MGPSDTEGAREEREGKKCRRGDERDSDPTEARRGEAKGGDDGKCFAKIGRVQKENRRQDARR